MNTHPGDAHPGDAHPGDAHPGDAHPDDANLSLQHGFAQLLPRIELHARIFFRHLSCPQRQSDAIAETVALAWLWYVRLRRQGKDPSRFASSLATYADCAVKCGRRLCGQERATDVLSGLAQARHGLAVRSLAPDSASGEQPWQESLRDNRRSPIPDQVNFRCDLPRWRRRQARRQRQIMDLLMFGELSGAVAQKHGLSSGRISQLRRHFRDSWERFVA